MADPALKLFGRTIQLADIGSSSGSDVDPVILLGCENKDTFDESKSAEEVPIEVEQVEQQNSSSSLNTNQDNNDQQASSNSDKEKSEKGDQPDVQEKVLKKPDKILPCPRCNSLDTKFCYYNNYNVNQPRHFCKNCQRYWTAGGTMRNVPVGAGRRKNKHSVPHFRPIIVPSESTINSSVLKFGPGEATPTFESASSVFNLNEQMRKAEISTANEEPSSASSSSNGIPESTNFSNAPPLHPLQYYAGPPWAFSWGIPPILGPPFCAPLPFVPAPFWPAVGPWNVPWTASNNIETNGSNSPMLGKHSRDEASVIQGNESATEKRSLWVPKTLRIDDPDEAAKSSIWTTLGIKPDDEGGMFKAYKSKAKSAGHKVDASSSPSLTANPAALSRSHSFQEGV